LFFGKWRPNCHKDVASCGKRRTLCRKSQDMDVSLISAMILLAGFAVCGTASLTWLARRIAPQLGYVDCPDARRKLHRLPTPLVGGVAVLIGLASTVLLFSLTLVDFTRPTTQIVTQTAAEMQLKTAVVSSSPEYFLVWALVTAAMFCGIGIYDDRWPLRPRTKFCLQILACLPDATFMPALVGVSILGWDIPLGGWGPALTVFWLVACVNAFNLVDGMDGQATSLGCIACTAFAGLALLQGDLVTAAFGLLVVANLAGFLIFNLPPAKIFLGDAGSLMLGFLAGALALKSAQSTSGQFAILPSCVILAVPLFDTAMAIIRRKLNGRGIGEADREHIHHCLQDRGLSRWKALALVSSVAAIQGLLAVIGSMTHCESISVWGSICVLFSLVRSQLFGYREASLAWQQLVRISARLRPVPPRRFNPLEWLAF
jgi:UDP-GlcNAc:undecaprenyl-phosphate GlcNAc-1-phosphate transferase